VRRGEVSRRFMTEPGIGAIVAITYKSTLDDPSRITKSKNPGPLFGFDAQEVPIGRDGRHRRDQPG
jgi:hypothetical protein